MPCSLPRWLRQVRFRLLPCPHGLPRSIGGSASTTSLSRPAQASRVLQPVRLFALLNRGLCHEAPVRSVTLPNCSSATEPCRWLLGWVLPPLVVCPSGHAIEHRRHG